MIDIIFDRNLFEDQMIGGYSPYRLHVQGRDSAVWIHEGDTDRTTILMEHGPGFIDVTISTDNWTVHINPFADTIDEYVLADKIDQEVAAMEQLETEEDY